MRLTNLGVQQSQTQLWNRFQLISAKQRLPQALLLIGPETAGIIDFAYKMAALILCSQESNSCGECKSCHLIQAREHPDFSYLGPEQTGGTIKIDQIRELHNLAYRSPQLANKRIIVIHPAEKMNVSASNALLKLLEEPPECVIFILIAEQISTLPPTIISRCQQWHFSFVNILEADYLTMAEGYNSESERGVLFSQLTVLIHDLAALLREQLSICALADKWSKYDLSHLTWLLYLINSQMVDYKFNGRRHEKSWTEPLYLLSEHFQPIDLFNQLDILNEIIRKLQQNISINQILTLENLLFTYKKENRNKR